MHKGSFHIVSLPHCTLHWSCYYTNLILKIQSNVNLRNNLNYLV